MNAISSPVLAKKYRWVRRFARTTVVALLWQVIAPVAAHALTSGPSQPEAMAFTPAGANGMVNLFTGDFQYSLPVLELPGPNGSYPFTLGYGSGIGMDQEASWVGLGWNLNPGAITREMRGLPDEFKGDVVKVEQDMKTDVTVGVSFGPNLEIFGGDFPVQIADLSLYYNTFRGFGYSLSRSFNIGSGGKENGLGVNVGLGVSLDSQEGIGFNPSLSVSKSMMAKQGKFNGSSSSLSVGLGTSYNSREGLSGINLGISGASRTNVSLKTIGFSRSGSFSTSAGAGFAQSAFLPSVTTPFSASSINGSIKLGVSFFGLHPNADIGVFYSEKKINPRFQHTPAYGYQNLEAAGPEDMMDFNLHNEGPMRKEMPNLPLPVLTNDVYHVSGQGVGGSFRAWRNDIGVLNHRQMQSETGAAGIGFDLSFAHLGFDANLNYGESTNRPWTNDNTMANFPNGYSFHDGAGYAADYEKWYFKMLGDQVSDPLNDMDYLGNEAAVRLDLGENVQDIRRVFPVQAQVRDKNGSIVGPTLESYVADPSRRSRNSTVQSLSNDELGGNNEGLAEYRIRHYVHNGNAFSADSSQLQTLSRNRPGHHSAGMAVTGTNGMRYVYALPAYNEKHIENVFSTGAESAGCKARVPVWDNDNNGRPDYEHAQSDKFLSRKEVPSYAHSHLLSSVLGNDYVDADATPGPSNDDLGFWVKFNYVKTDAAMKWRAPFLGANLDKGNESEFEDDRANYMYGEKENWYLATAETKTHIAEFHISRRNDGRGAAGEFQNNPASTAGVAATLGGHQYKLDSISLFSKAERYPSPNVKNNNAQALRVVHFEYSYELCKDVWNNASYDPSPGPNPANSGKLTLKSVWTTHEQSSRGALNPVNFHYNGLNPDYDPLAQDRWGNYQPYANECDQLAFPYVNHDPGRAALDSYASAWSLTDIDLPSGGKVEVTYEADDYGYVQNKTAMRMMKITDFYAKDGLKIFKDDYNPNNPSHRRVYFNPGFVANTKGDLHPLLEDLDQIYFKLRMKVRKANENAIEYVGAYAEVEDYGVDSHGSYVQLKKPTWNNGKWANFHPIALAGWNHLRANMPRLVTGAPPINVQPGTSTNTIKQKAKSLLSVGGEVLKVFKGYYKFARDKGFSSEFDASHSWVRLKSANKTKVGGGCRVKQIVMRDDWGANPNTRAYSNDVGVVYDYSTKEGFETISSGVAAYEPLVGGDENPFRQAKFYPGSTPLMSDQNLFFQYPINEPFMPGPTVGYRKVTVKSLATQQVIDGQLAATVPTTGAAIHEFWTAKDYPVFTDETPAVLKPFNLSVPIPLVGGLEIHDLTGSQGYSVTLNDMHGKQRKVSNYGMTADGNLDSEPISWVEYDYADEVHFPGSAKEYRKLNNEFDVLLGDVDPNDYRQSEYGERNMGQDHEMMVFLNEMADNSGGVGLAYNTDVMLFGLPWPAIWPNMRYSQSKVRTAVTNKVVYRSGRVTGMTAFNEGSLIQTDHLAFDEQTGRPLLSRVTNNYGDPVYSYQYPGRWAYDQMGAAYQNMGLSFTANVSSPATNYYTATNYDLNGREAELLVPGDEYLIAKNNNRFKAWFVEFDAADDPIFYSTDNLSGSNIGFQNVRSGRRNLLGVNTFELTALKDPTRDRDTMRCWKSLAAPNEVMDSSWVVSDTIRDTVLAPCVKNWVDMIETYVDQGGGFMAWNGNNNIHLEDYCISCETPSISLASPTNLLIECSGACNYQLLDGNGTAVPWLGISALQSPVFASSLPFAAPTGWSNANVELLFNTGSGPQTGYLISTGGSGCALPFNTYESVVNEYYSEWATQPDSLTRVNEMFMVDSVLSASAQTFTDAWVQNFNEIRFSEGDAAAQLNALQYRNPWMTGQRGIWRPQSSYVYVTERQQSAEVNTRKDGTFSGVPVFDFQSSLHSGCDENWRKVKEVTRYSPYSYEVENRDVLGVYSSALYGYNGKMPIAVSANADYNQMGFEGFEEYAPNANLDALEMSTGNLHFYTDASVTPPEILDFLDLTYVDGVDAYPNGTTPSGASLTGLRPIEGRTIGSYFDPAVNVLDWTTALGTTNGLILFQEPYKHLDPDSMWTGRFGLQVLPQPPLALNGTVDYSDAKAHTGERSLRWTGNLEWRQHHLRLDQNERYAVQAWVSRDDTELPFYTSQMVDPEDRIGIEVHFYDNLLNPIGSSGLFEPQGNLVEGWQKVEGEFEMPGGALYVSIELQSGKTKNSTLTAYLDDIRLQPLASRMSTHVYDTGDYRLRATLDDDNFALRYLYDEAGNVYLVQKETAEGWRTVKESRGFYKEVGQ